MKFITLTTNLLLVATAVLASPLLAHEQAAIDAFRARRSLGRSNAFRAGSNNTGETMNSTSWAGVAILQTGVTEVSGTFTVPQPQVPADAIPYVSYCGVAWVGIDGWSNLQLIQTGVLWCTWTGNGYQSYFYPWYEYLPGYITPYDGVNVTAGSVVTVSATKTGTYSGVTTLTVDGVTVSHNFTGESSPLFGTSAEWIVEDYLFTDYSNVPFADFGSVTFTGATAVVDGATITPGEGNWIIIDLESENGTLTSSSFSGSTVTVNYK